MLSIPAKYSRGLLLPLITLVFAGMAVMMTMTIKDQFLPVIAIGYVAIYWTLCWYRPDIVLMLIFVCAPFQNDLTEGGAPARFAIAELNLALAVPVFIVKELLQRRLPRVGPVLIPALIYLIICVFSGIMNWHGVTAFDPDDKDRSSFVAMAQMILYMIVATMMFSSYCKDIRRLYSCFYVFIGCGVFLALVGFATGSNYFLGLGKNGVGASLANAAVLSVEMWMIAKTPRAKGWLALAFVITCAGMIVSLSRGSWVAMLIGVAILLVFRSEWKVALKLFLLMTALGAISWAMMTPQEQNYVVGLGRDHQNIELRYKSLDYANVRFQQSPVFGLGIWLRKDYDATNVVMAVLAETGVAGLLSFFSIFVVLAWMFWKTRKLLSVDDPLFPFVSIAAALTFGRLAHGMVDHYWSRGPILNSWASVGMATAAYTIAVRRARRQWETSKFRPHAFYEEGPEFPTPLPAT